MQNITRNQALEAMSQGKVVGFVNISGVEMWEDLRGNLLFKHRCGKIELLNHMTINDESGYCILRDKTRRIFKTK